MTKQEPNKNHLTVYEYKGTFSFDKEKLQKLDPNHYNQW
jgi:hypothetical protein